MVSITRVTPEVNTHSKQIYQDTPALPADEAQAIVTFADVLEAIAAITNNGDLKPDERKTQITRTLSGAIGSIDRAYHSEIEAALKGAGAGFTKTDARNYINGCVFDAKQRNKKAARLRAETARANLLTVRETKGKVSIDVGRRQLSDIAEQALTELGRANGAKPSMFVRGGVLVRIAKDERGYYGIHEFNDRAMLHELSKVADWETIATDADGNPQTKAVFPPVDVIREIFGRPSWVEFPALTGIVNAPVFSRDGILHDKPGYNPATRLFYTGGVQVGRIEPTPANIDYAKSLILGNLLVDFPFKDDASRAHAVAYLLLPFVRDMIDGVTPVYDVDSPTPGTGKGKLLNACAYPFLGHDVPTMTAVDDENEWRKRITTSLLNGNTHLVIDNVNSKLDSGVLASAFTQPVWEDRTLGANREVKIPIRTIWAITANNIAMSQEITRRCVWIRLDANVEKPHERTDFKHKNLLAWASENRNKLVTAALTLVQAWIDAGKPEYTKRTKGSYEDWAGIMGGILETVGIPGFLDNEDELYDRVVSKGDLLGDFVTAWWDKFGAASTSAFELFKLASFSDSEGANQLGDWQNLLADMLGAGNQRSRQTKLGAILSANQDKVAAGHKIQFDKVLHGLKYWKLETANQGKGGEPG